MFNIPIKFYLACIFIIFFQTKQTKNEIKWLKGNVNVAGFTNDRCLMVSPLLPTKIVNCMQLADGFQLTVPVF